MSDFVEKLLFGPERTRRKVSVIDMSPLRHYEDSDGCHTEGIVVVGDSTIADESWVLQFARGFVKGIF